MAFHDNMAPSPERPSSKRKDGGEKRSPKKAKKLKRDEGQSSKQFENNRDETLYNRNQYDGKEEYKRGADRKDMRSKSPIQEPSSSKNHLHSTSRSQERKEDRHSHDSFSERSHRSSGREMREYRERHSSKEIKDSNQSRPPAASYKFNEVYSKPLPPGAKGNFDDIINDFPPRLGVRFL